MTDGSEPTVPRSSEPAAPDVSQPPEPPLLPPQPAAPSDPAGPPPPTPPAPLVAWDAPASPPPAEPPAAPPLVAWAPQPPAPIAATAGAYADGPPAFTVGAILSDTFARYGADFLRLFVVAAVPTAISLLSSFASLPAPGTNPFLRPTGFVDTRGILSLVTFIVGIVGGAALIALAEGGRGLPLMRAIRRGAERAGWLFLTTLLLGLGFVLLFVVAAIPILLLAVIKPVLVIVPFVALLLIVIWAALRVSLAFPATVADNLNAIEAIKLSWRITRPAGVWGRILGAYVLLGLLFVPASFGTGLFILPAMFSAMFGEGSGTIPLPVLLLFPAIVLSVFTPLTSLLTYSAYRRLVPPLQPSWTVRAAATALPAAVAPPVAMDITAATLPAASLDPGTAPSLDPATAVPPAPVAPPPASPTAATPSTPAFRVPGFGTAAKGLLALAIAADVVGVVAIPFGVSEMVRVFRDFHGFPGLAPGTGLPGANGVVQPGRVVFARNVDLEACTAASPVFLATSSSNVEWLATPQLPVTTDDEVFLRISLNGDVLETTLQDPAAYRCVGSDVAIPDLQGGVYTYDLIVDGSVSATGTLLVQH
jgi:hypothetical protein